MRVEEDRSPSYNTAQSMIPVNMSMSLKCNCQPTLIMEKYVICFRPDRSLSEVYFKYKLPVFQNADKYVQICPKELWIVCVVSTPKAPSFSTASPQNKHKIHKYF